MPQQLDELDTRLLNLIQREIPLVDRPFGAIGRELGLAERQVIDRMNALKDPPKRVIRQISAIFDTKALGYRSSLVAAKVDPGHMDAAAAIIGAHPGVTHNYQRNHAYNLWYTVAVAPDSRLGLENTVQLLHRLSGAAATRLFPTLRLYKIGVSFDLSGESDAAARSDRPAFSEEQRQQAMGFAVTDVDKRMIRVLQQDLPLVERPFDDWAKQAGVGLDELLSAARAYKQQNRMRRFSAVLHHRQAGISANGMGAWAVPAEKQDEFGALAASFAAVSHCYLRPTYEDWPYSIFTMVHGATMADCTATFAAMAEASGVREFVALYSSREFKKTRLKYFTPEIEQWEREHAM